MTTSHELWYQHGGAGDPVVLLHSSVADARMWDPQWAALTGAFHVVRMDFRGHGRTPCRADGPYSDAGDVAAVLATLDLTGVTLVGSSYGGRVALELATEHPDLVSRLVLFNAGCDLPPTPDLEAFDAEEDRLIEAGDIGGAVELNVRTWLGPEADDETRKQLAEMQRHAFETQLAADPLPERRRGRIDLSLLGAPALVVAGGRDLPYFRESARHIAGSMADATLVELDWAGHLPNLERPDEVTSLLLKLL
ncbi:alpha/beta fold hydrolase [Sphaerimonospora thailandensis]|uniref:Alpha/beta hydrolase n=1 Tax=Sphaerimonospora thailandensis TaxID=795644 RepID=A0A8J3W065_9ACTN|nr:alpha/beta hydrolase [Sphaerimonospora thailandensis]GIH71929.1 alpha/beta hydrolase [Sphaerimonospora thailandensis]